MQNAVLIRSIVVEWATEALDKVRVVASGEEHRRAAKAVAVSRGKGRPRKDDTEAPDRSGCQEES